MAYVNNCDNDCFVHRVYALPLVHEGVDKLVGVYYASKAWSSFVASALGHVESVCDNVLEVTKPYYDNKYVGGSARLASRIGARALDALENRYPAMRSTDSAMLKQRYYDGSIVQRGMQSVVDTRDSAVEKVNNVMIAVRARMTAITCAFIATLDYCENAVEHYIANDLPKEDHNYARRAAFARITRLPARIVYGVDAKVRRRWQQLQSFFYKTLDDTWKMWQRVQEWSTQQANRAIELPSNTLLYTVRTSTTMATRVSGTILEYASASTYVPVMAINPLQTANAYMHTMQESAEKTTSVRALCQSVYSEMTSRVHAMGMLATDLLAHLQSHRWLNESADTKTAKKRD